MTEQNDLVVQQLLPFINFAYVSEQRPTVGDINDWITIPLQVEHAQASTTGVNDVSVLMGHVPTLKTLVTDHELRVSIAKDLLSQAAHCVGNGQSSYAADAIPGPSKLPGCAPLPAPLISSGPGSSGTSAAAQNSSVSEATSAFVLVPRDTPPQQAPQLTSAAAPAQKASDDEMLSDIDSAPNQVSLLKAQRKEADMNEQHKVSVKKEPGAAASSNNVFECPECGKPYENARTLQGHRRKHLGEHELVFRCSCGMRYSRKSGLSYHLRKKPYHTSLEVSEKEQTSVPEWLQTLSPSGDLFSTLQETRKRPASCVLGLEEEFSEDDDIVSTTPSTSASVPRMPKAPRYTPHSG